jgi:hypothetical protein
MVGKKDLGLPKGKTVKKPDREPDHFSKRGVPYWWAPEWVRGSGNNYGRIIPIKVNQYATDLHMLSKDGNCSYIQGSIQREFQQWHTDNEIDYILLGMDYSSLNVTDWEYEDV